MMHLATRRELEAVPVTPYRHIRHQLRTGDVIFCAGDYVFSKLIARATGSPVTHVGIVLRFEELNSVCVLEAVENFGVRLAPLSCMVDGRSDERYRGMVFVARSSKVTQNVSRATRWAMRHLAQPYSYLTILTILVRIMRLSARDGDPDRRGWICSEFAARWLALAGDVDLFSGNGKRLLTPSDLWAHSSLSLVARLL